MNPKTRSTENTQAWWSIELESKPDFDLCMKRIYAWFEQQILDRPPVRFTRHNAEYEIIDEVWKDTWQGQKDRWFDIDYQIEKFLTQVQNKHYHGETFPIFWPNLGPNVFAGLYGCPLEFGETTSWAEAMLPNLNMPVKLDWNHEFMRILTEQTEAALSICKGKFLVGYTDLHPGLDWFAALRGTEPALYDLIDFPQAVLSYLGQCTTDFLEVFNFFDNMLKKAGQPSVTWMAIPSFGKLHIPSSDFASMISPRQFQKFAMPFLEQETLAMTHNIFHVDGKGVANHIDHILELPNIHAIQWVQGLGLDTPIMQWVPLIKKVQAAGKSLVLDITLDELEPLMAALDPEGILLCLASDDEEQEIEILKRVEKW